MLDKKQTLDYARSCLSLMANKATDADDQRHLRGAANALGVAEERIFALEAVVKELARRAGLKRHDIGHPIGRQFSDARFGDLLG